MNEGAAEREKEAEEGEHLTLVWPDPSTSKTLSLDLAISPVSHHYHLLRDMRPKQNDALFLSKYDTCNAILMCPSTTSLQDPLPLAKMS